MDWFQTIDAYCERTDAGFWSEPVNALTNLAFFAAIVPAAAELRRRRAADPAAIALMVLVALIGTGSFLFHTVATRWAALADVLPISLFILAYFGLALARFLGLRFGFALAGTVAFFAASLLAEPVLAPVLGSSAGYGPGLLAMLGIGGLLLARGASAARPILVAGAVFAVSIALRMADEPLCSLWPLGTHFLWHCLNAVTLGLLLWAAVRSAVCQGQDGRHA